MRRGLIFVYGVLSYTLFLATISYAIGFIGNIGVPKSMDSAPSHPLIASFMSTRLSAMGPALIPSLSRRLSRKSQTQTA